MDAIFNAILAFLTGLFGILLGMAYFLPIVLLILGLVIAVYLHQRRGKHTVFTAEEPGEEAKRRRR